jgi:hypothetical protein
MFMTLSGVVAAFLRTWNASKVIDLIDAIPMGRPFLMVALHL